MDEILNYYRVKKIIDNQQPPMAVSKFMVVNFLDKADPYLRSSILGAEEKNNGPIIWICLNDL